MTRVLLVEVRHPGVVRAARRAGLRIHYLGGRADAPDWLDSGADSATLLDDTSRSSMLAAARSIHVEHPFDAAVSLNDLYVELAAEINEMLALPGNSPAVPRAVNDKARMREILRGSPVATVIASRVRTADEVKIFAAEAGYPFVIKPVDGSGSREVVLVPDEEGLDAAVARTVSTADGTGDWIAEEYLDGPEFSVETFSAGGVHHLLAVTEKFKGANFVEVGHVVPARLSPEHAEALVAEVTACLDAVGLVEGPGHTEVVLTLRGPRIIETHCRPGGDGIVELVRLAFGPDLHQVIFDWLAGRPLGLSPAAAPRAAATWFLTPGSGTVSGISGLAEARSSAGVTEAYVTVGPGDQISELRSSADRPGAVLAVGDTPEHALQRAREAVSRIVITFEH